MPTAVASREEYREWLKKVSTVWSLPLTNEVRALELIDLARKMMSDLDFLLSYQPRDRAEALLKYILLFYLRDKLANKTAAKRKLQKLADYMKDPYYLAQLALFVLNITSAPDLATALETIDKLPPGSDILLRIILDVPLEVKPKEVLKGLILPFYICVTPY